MYKQLGMVVAFLCVATITTAQQCSLELKGTVKDFHDGKPLEFAQIYFKELERTVTTKIDGSYKVDGLCRGTYTVIITHFECQDKQVQFFIDQNLKRDFVLEHHVNALDQINIVADVHDSHDQTQSTTRISESTLNDYSGAALGDALATVQGVSSLKTGNSVVKPVIHGLYGSRVAIVNGGIRQQDQEWGLEHSPNIDLNTAVNIEVVKGATALRYGGDAVGGTIIIDSERYLAKDTLKGKLISQLQSNGRGGSITGSISNYSTGGWYQQGTVTYKRLGDYRAADYILSNTGSENYSGNFKVGYHQLEYGASINYSYYNTELGILRASHVGSIAGLVRSINSRQPLVVEDFTYNIESPKQEVQHHGVHFNGYRRFEGLGKLEVDYSYQFNNRLEYDIRRSSQEASMDLDLTTHTIAGYLLVDSNDNFDWEAGVDGMYQENFPNPATGVRRLIPDYESYRIGAFTSLNYKAGEQWLFDAGLRLDYYNIDAYKYYIQTRWQDLGYDEEFESFEVSVTNGQILTNPVLDYGLLAYSAGVKYITDDHYDFSLNLSSANRAPNPSELFSDGLHHALASIELGQLDLKKEQSHKLNAVGHMNRRSLDVEINPYLNMINNYIQLVPSGLEETTRGSFPVYQYEQVDAIMAGIDLSSNWKIIDNLGQDSLGKDQLSLHSTFSYLYGQNKTDSEPLILLPPTQFYNELVWSNAIGPHIDLKISNQAVLKQTRFPDNDYVATFRTDEGMDVQELVKISESPAGYNLWNAGATYTWGKSIVNLRVNNIFNTNYRSYLNRQRFYADDIGTDVQLQWQYKF